MTSITKSYYKRVPPDGGFGYIICFAGIVILAPATGYALCLGMAYNDLMLEIGMKTTGIGFLNGLNAMCFAISGFMTSPLLKLLSIRQLAFVAAILFNIGAFGVPFTHSAIPFFICLSFFQNTGFGILYNLVFTTLKNYFLKKRLFAATVVQTANAVSSMSVPMIVKVATEYYGHRGMLLILTSLSMQMFIGIALLQPVAWHMKKVKIQEENVTEMKILLAEDKISNPTETPVVKLTDIEKPTYDGVKEDSIVKKILKEIFDVKLMKEFLPSYNCMGLGLTTFAEFIYILMLPRAYYSYGFSQEYVATALSLVAFGDLSMRITIVCASKWLIKIGSKQLHLTGVMICLISRTGLLLSTDKTVMLVLITIMGTGRAFTTVLFPIVVADAVGPEKYSAALGLLMIIMGIINLTVGPIIGAIRDYTGSYYIIFWISNALFGVVIAMWIIERYFVKAKRKQNQDS